MPLFLVLCLTYCIFQTIRRIPQIWEENGGASYSLNVVYLARLGGRVGGGGAGSEEAGAGPHFLLQKIFSYFSSSKS